uniref:C2H2-type domain-containing protein n=1 Tax=Globodera rostochiensis TaxID=31243 RepID=A0A914HJ94_GLORO
MFQCNIAGCDRSFTTGNGRAIHIGRSHNKVQTNPPYPCSICEFGAYSASTINQHMRRRHEDTTIPRLRGAHHWPGSSIGIYMSENMIEFSAFTRHWEHHRIDGCRPGMFKCSVCDYSSNTRNVVLFHEHNHHLVGLPRKG